MSQAIVLSADDLKVGMRVEFARDVLQADIDRFGELTGDRNPLHCDTAYAESTNYSGTIAHGAFQVSLCTALAGMHLPGRSCLITSIDASFPSPLKVPTAVVLQAEIVAWNRGLNAGRVRAAVLDRARSRVCCEVGIGFSLHEQRSGDGSTLRDISQPSGHKDDTRRVVLVTGAAGGLGRMVVRDLLSDHAVVALVNTSPLPDELLMAGAESISGDLADAHIADKLLRQLDGRRIYGVVHFAWPGLARGGLMNQPPGRLEAQVLAGTCQIVELGRMLQKSASGSEGRLICAGSIAGTHTPVSSLAGYSLGKGAMEHTVRLLAAELGIHRITVNAVCPSLLPVGMNSQIDSRRQKVESAAIPLGRLCAPSDVINAIRWFLSPEACFVSGQILGVNGGQL